MIKRRWKKLDCVVCTITNVTATGPSEVTTCLACNGTLAFFLNDNDEIAHVPDGSIVGSWGNKFKLLDDDGVPDWVQQA